MGKLIVGSLSFSFGLLLTFTGVGALIGIPMMLGGGAAAVIGFGQLGLGAAKTGTKLGKIYRDTRTTQDERAELEELRAERARRLADERTAV